MLISKNSEKGDKGAKAFDENDLMQITKSLTLEIVKKGNYVFKYQDIGDKFYIILKGEVGVYLPNPIYVGEKMRKERKQKYDELE